MPVTNQPHFLSSEIQAALGNKNSNQSGKKISAELVEKKFSRITTDSRQIQTGDLFIALAGEQSDGHNFIPAALEKKAGGILCSKKYAEENFISSADSKESFYSKQNPDCQIFTASDTLLAYRLLAREWRRKFAIPAIAICGSAGKTTTKEFAAAIFRGRWSGNEVLQTLASQNGFAGIPATLFRLAANQKAAIIEIGIDEPGAMEQHLTIAEPTAGILTSIGAEHLEKLIDIETVALEEEKLFHYLLDHRGKIAINADDEIIFRDAGKFLQSDHVFFAIDNHPCGNFQGRALLGMFSADSGILKVDWRENKKIIASAEFFCPLEGKHNARNLLGAIALGDLYGLNPAEMQKGLATFTAPEGRGHIQFFNGAKLFCDTYNANPISMRAALEFLRGKSSSQNSSNGKSWAILGDMLELGNKELELHRELADLLLSLQIDQILLFGPRMQKLQEELKNRGHKSTLHYSEQIAITNRLRAELKTNDHVLIKGSRGMRMENIWQALTSS